MPKASKIEVQLGLHNRGAFCKVIDGCQEEVSSMTSMNVQVPKGVRVTDLHCWA